MTIDIALCIILHPEGRQILVARRPDNVHLPGFWEFPGGKVEPGETIVDCCIREAREEVALEVTVLRELPSVVHAYPDRTVRLHPVLCQATSTDARPLASSEVRWVEFGELAGLRFPEGNREIVEGLVKKMPAHPALENLL